MIQFDHVSLKYGNGPDILKDISFTLPARSFYFLTGASGAGKSSLLRLIYLGARPSAGEVVLMGKKTGQIRRAEIPALRLRIGVVFQDFRLLAHLNALDNVALPLRLAGAPEEEAVSHARELLRWVGLGGQIYAKPLSLSGGEQQRMAIARAVVARPQILIADEPAGSVDEDQAQRMMHLFTELNKVGATVIIATHNQALIDRAARPVLHLHKGRLGVH